jgi:hypothetical protein
MSFKFACSSLRHSSVDLSLYTIFSDNPNETLEGVHIDVSFEDSKKVHGFRLDDPLINFDVFLGFSTFDNMLRGYNDLSSLLGMRRGKLREFYYLFLLILVIFAKQNGQTVLD